jgi:predicted transcriptional regulator
MKKNKSHDPLYSKSTLGSRISQKHTNRTILRSDREYPKSIRIEQVRDLVDSADAVEKPSDKKIQGVTAMSESVSFTPLKKRDLNKLGVPEQARKRRRFKRSLTSLLEAPLQGTEP